MVLQFNNMTYEGHVRDTSVVFLWLIVQGNVANSINSLIIAHSIDWVKCITYFASQN